MVIASTTGRRWIERTALVLALAVPSVAAADAPYFGLLDRGTNKSRLGLDLTYVHVETLDFPDGLIRIEPHLEYVTGGSWGAYASLPFLGTFVDSNSDTTLGNPEIGGLFVPSIPIAALVLRGGVTLPFAGTEDAGTLLLASQGRIVDVVQALPETFAVRASASLISDLPMVGLRADIGVDLPVADLSDAVDVENDPIVHIGGGASVGLLGFKLALELVNVFTSSDSTDNFSQLGLSAHFGLGPLNTYVGLTTLVDGFVEDEQDRVYTGMAGASLNLP